MTPPADGADLRAAFVASCLRGATKTSGKKRGGKREEVNIGKKQIRSDPHGLVVAKGSKVLPRQRFLR